VLIEKTRNIKELMGVADKVWVFDATIASCEHRHIYSAFPVFVNPIPISDDSIVTVLTVAFAVISGLVAYWKNNSFTEAAQSADEVLKEIK
jgi:hypothetical protein